jgi:hypothetical protein
MNYHNFKGAGMVANACNPKVLRRQRSGGFWFKATSGKKLVRLPLNQLNRHGDMPL